MLNNGCLCCTARGDLVRMIGELVERKKKKKRKFPFTVLQLHPTSTSTYIE
uniref:Uncharacterized protein LOC105140217 n=1 Tax=Rhizophora mucronata TaxID=61149 RepID=A0A2P2J7N0_RHIMU